MQAWYVGHTKDLSTFLNNTSQHNNLQDQNSVEDLTRLYLLDLFSPQKSDLSLGSADGEPISSVSFVPFLSVFVNC